MRRLGAWLLSALCLTAPLSRGAWGPEERLTTNTTVAETGLNHGALAVDSQGAITVAWAEQDGPGSNFQIHTRTKPPGGAWGPDEIAVAFREGYVGTSLGSKFPALAVLPGDSLLMVWHDYRIDGIQNAELFTKVRGPGEAWGDSTTEVRLTTSQHPETNGDNSYMPNLAVTPEGNAHVVWYDYRYDADHAEILTKSRTGGAWNTAPGDAPDTNLSQNSGESHFPALAAGPGGALHLAWRDNTGGSFRVWYRRRSPAGVWESAQPLSPEGVAAAGVDVAAAEDGRVVVVWSDARYGGQTLFLRVRSATGVWGVERQVSPTGAGAEEATVEVDALLQCHVVWQDGRISPFNRELFYQTQPLGAAWDSTGNADLRLTDAAGSSARPTLALDRSNRLCLVWQDARHGATEIYYREQASAVGVPEFPEPLHLAPARNPFRGAVTWILTGIDLEDAEAWILDVRGRRVQHLLPRGNRWKWNGTTAAGTPAAPGVYFLELRQDGRLRGRSKVVKLP